MLVVFFTILKVPPRYVLLLYMYFVNFKENDNNNNDNSNSKLKLRFLPHTCPGDDDDFGDVGDETGEEDMARFGRVAQIGISIVETASLVGVVNIKDGCWDVFNVFLTLLKMIK